MSDPGVPHGKIDEALVRYLCRLSRLTLSERELAVYSAQIAEIVRYVEKLQTVDTEGVPPTSHVAAARNVLRPDETAPSRDRADILANAPDVLDGCFKVPRVV